MPQATYYKDYKTPRFNNQTNSVVPDLRMDSDKMNPNRENLDHLPSLPPLIRMSRSPPPLCSIPKEMRNMHSYEPNRFSSSQQEQQRPNNTPMQESSQNSTPPRCSGSPGRSAGPCPEKSGAPNRMQSNTRMRRSESTNRELIDMVKKQLEQLNKTLAALERSNDGDDNIHVDQITPPSEMIDQMKGKTSICITLIMV